MVKETPPHAWGRHIRKASEARKAGNTPTCVGKTGEGSPSLNWIRKHPHMRGEDEREYLFNNNLLRNTPTCVGKTEKRDNSYLNEKKHPHMRGEDQLA